MCIWICQFQQDLSNNLELKAFVDSVDMTPRLDPRDSFFGGRTNALRLHYQTCAEWVTIQYDNIISLDPSVNKCTRYSQEHHRTVASDFGELSSYFGIAKLMVSHPRGLLHPFCPTDPTGN